MKLEPDGVDPSRLISVLLVVLHIVSRLGWTPLEGSPFVGEVTSALEEEAAPE